MSEENKKENLTKIGFWVSYCLALIILFLLGFQVAQWQGEAPEPAFIGLALNEWGDFFAGFGTLTALVWLVISHRQQQHDLSLQMEQLALQNEELSAQREVHKEAVTVQMKTFAHEKLRYIDLVLAQLPDIEIKRNGEYGDFKVFVSNDAPIVHMEFFSTTGTRLSRGLGAKNGDHWNVAKVVLTPSDWLLVRLSDETEFEYQIEKYKMRSSVHKRYLRAFRRNGFTPEEAKEKLASFSKIIEQAQFRAISITRPILVKEKNALLGVIELER